MYRERLPGGYGLWVFWYCLCAGGDSWPVCRVHQTVRRGWVALPGALGQHCQHCPGETLLLQRGQSTLMIWGDGSTLTQVMRQWPDTNPADCWGCGDEPACIFDTIVKKLSSLKTIQAWLSSPPGRHTRAVSRQSFQILTQISALPHKGWPDVNTAEGEGSAAPRLGSNLSSCVSAYQYSPLAVPGNPHPSPVSPLYNVAMQEHSCLWSAWAGSPPSPSNILHIFHVPV